MADYSNSKLTEMTKLPGIADLPLAVRAKLGKALIAEANGEMVEAAELLQKALEAEAKVREA